MKPGIFSEVPESEIVGVMDFYDVKNPCVNLIFDLKKSTNSLQTYQFYPQNKGIFSPFTSYQKSTSSLAKCFEGVVYFIRTVLADMEPCLNDSKVRGRNCGGRNLYSRKPCLTATSSGWGHPKTLMESLLRGQVTHSGDGMQELSDQQLVQGFRSGDETAFEELVLRYRNQVYNTILNILHDRDLAWDGAQEIFLKLYQKMDTYQGKCPVGAWIYRIALNHGLNMLRKRKRLREEVPLEESYMSVEVTNGPSQDMMKGEFKNEELSFAIEKLPKVQKSVIILRHFSELSFREIADVLGKSEDSVKSNHYYAIAKLRKKLKRGESS